MVAIIIPGRGYRYGKTRGEQERNLRKDGLGTMSDEQLDKCSFLEKKAREQGSDRNFFDKHEIDSVR